MPRASPSPGISPARGATGWRSTCRGRRCWRRCPPDRLGVELVRLPWSPGLAALAPALPPGQVVLTGADRAAAIGWGWEAGVTLFEGRLLRPRSG